MENSRRTLVAFSLALLVHVLLFGVLLVSLGWSSKLQPTNQDSEPIVQATVVDREKVLAELERQEQAEQQLTKTQDQAQKIAEQTKQEAKKQQELAQQQQEKERLKQLEAERKAREEARRKAEAEKKRIEEAKRRAEAEKRRLEEERRQAEAAERKAEEERKRAEAARRKAKEERRQQELQARIEAEQRAEQKRQVESALERFRSQVKLRVRRYWIRPASARDNMVALLQVELLPSGDVRNVKVVESSGNRAFDRSAEAAVYKAAPLPVPANPAVVEQLRSFYFKFTPGN